MTLICIFFWKCFINKIYFTNWTIPKAIFILLVPAEISLAV